jgi:hypothetical protein
MVQLGRNNPQPSQVQDRHHLRLGEDAAGLSAASITRGIGAWEAEYEASRKRDLWGVDYVYLLGGRHPHERAPGRAGPALLAGGGGGAAGRHEGARPLAAFTS